MTRPGAEEICRRVSYDPETGVLTWRADPPRGKKPGDALALRPNGNGYLYSTINRKHFSAHRLAFVCLHGRWPVEVDHVNNDKSDNRACNLREATRSQNEMNCPRRADNTSGFKGVGWHRHKGRWRAYIQKDGRHVSLGYHETPEMAHAAYVRAATSLFGDFARPS